MKGITANRFRAILAAALATAGASAHALSLQEAERALAERNRDIAMAAAAVRGAKGDAVTATRRPEPELSFGSSKISTIHGIGTGSYFDKRVDTTLGLSYLFERGGKRRWRSEQAGGLARAAGFDFADTRRQQMLALRSAYYVLKRSEETLELAQANRAAAERALDAADRRVKAGDLADVERARLAVDALKVADDARTAEREHVEAQQDLALLLGREQDYAGLSAGDDWPRIADMPEATSALERRSDVLAAAARVDAAEARRHSAQALRSRDITVGFGAERDPRDQSGTTWNFSVSVPLSGPHYHDGQIARAEADYDSATLARDKVRAEAQTEREHARVVLASARERLQRYDKELAPAAQRALDGVEFAHARGAASLTDLLDARRAWREAQGDLIAARSDYAIARAAWQAATQADNETTDTP